jgi:hypothetical protein
MARHYVRLRVATLPATAMPLAIERAPLAWRERAK